MLKSILKINGVQKLVKTSQKEVNGGRLILRPSGKCEDICVTAPDGTACGASHCPGVCTGNGGYVFY